MIIWVAFKTFSLHQKRFVAGPNMKVKYFLTSLNSRFFVHKVYRESTVLFLILKERSYWSDHVIEGVQIIQITLFFTKKNYLQCCFWAFKLQSGWSAEKLWKQLVNPDSFTERAKKFEKMLNSGMKKDRTLKKVD